jgi:hypothetical protein
MLKIIDENLKDSVLTVTAEVKLRITLDEKVRFVTTQDVKDLLKDKYDILNTLKNNQLSNSMRGGGKQKGTWMFQVKTKQQRKPRTTPQKAPASKPPSPAKTKSSTKPSIRGRMSKIAKQKNT